MKLRRRSYLVEANPGRDRAVRALAEKFYDDLYNFLDKRSDELVQRRDGGFSVHAMEFWSNKKRARNLGVVFTPSQGEIKGGIGKAGNLDVLVFAIMKGPGDKSNLAYRLQKKHVVHEMVHFLDRGRRSGGSVSRYHSVGAVSYYNSPGEWNAYWQEGASSAENMLKNIRNSSVDKEKQDKAIKIIFGRSISEFSRKANKIWDKGFMDLMDGRIRRKFDKRLAQLWNSFKKKGLL